MKPERAEATRKLDYGFTLTEPELRRLSAILNEQMKIACKGNKFTTVFRLKFKNQITVEKSSVDEILAENNSDKWLIQFLEIEVFDDNIQLTQIQFTFKKGERETISYHIEGNDRNWVFLTQSLLDDRIKVIKQVNMQGSGLGLVAFLFIVAVALDIVSIMLVFDPAYKSSLAPTLGAKVILIIFFTILLVGIGTYVCSFPSNNFVWQDYKTSLEKRNSIGKFILVGVLLALVVNIISGVIVYIITTR